VKHAMLAMFLGALAMSIGCHAAPKHSCDSGCCEGGCGPGAHAAMRGGLREKMGCGHPECGSGGCNRHGLLESVWHNCGHKFAGCGAGGCGPGGCANGLGQGMPDPYAGAMMPAPGPSAGAVAYPYYTNRGPRDFLAKNPPSIGP